MQKAMITLILSTFLLVSCRSSSSQTPKANIASKESSTKSSEKRLEPSTEPVITDREEEEIDCESVSESIFSQNVFTDGKSISPQIIRSIYPDCDGNTELVEGEWELLGTLMRAKAPEVIAELELLKKENTKQYKYILSLIENMLIDEPSHFKELEKSVAQAAECETKEYIITKRVEPLKKIFTPKGLAAIDLSDSNYELTDSKDKIFRGLLQSISTEKGKHYLQFEDHNSGGDMTFLLHPVVKLYPEKEASTTLSEAIKKLQNKPVLLRMEPLSVNGEEELYVTEIIELAKERFSNAGIDDAKEVYNLITEMKQVVRDKKSPLLAGLISYPITIKYGDESYTVKDQKEAEGLSHIIFNEAVLSAILEQSYAEIFTNQYGLMIGSGELWFNPPTGNQKDFSLYAINPFPIISNEHPMGARGQTVTCTVKSLERLFEDEVALTFANGKEEIIFKLSASTLSSYTGLDNYITSTADGEIRLSSDMMGQKRMVSYGTITEENEMTGEEEEVNQLFSITL